MEKIKEIAVAILKKAVGMGENAILAVVKLVVNGVQKVLKKCTKAAMNKLLEGANPIAKIVMITSSIIAVVSAVIYFLGKKK